MAKRIVNHIKLGIFVMAGLAFLILLLYVIGSNKNMFGNTFTLKARFENVQGLKPGSNVRFGGIDAGTVKSIEVLNDTTIEVTLFVKEKMKNFIRKNAIVTITTDGLMGNKLVNLKPSKEEGPIVQEGDILYSTPSPDTDDILKVLNTTSSDIAVIASDLKFTVQRLNSSKALWGILEDESLPVNIRSSLADLKNASEKMSRAMINLNTIVSNVKDGKGSIGELLNDTTIAHNIKDAVAQIRVIESRADTLTVQMNTLVADISNKVNNGQGPVNALLENKEMTENLSNSLKNIEKGTRDFNEVMMAAKNNFLFRGYFRKLEQQKRKGATTRSNY